MSQGDCGRFGAAGFRCRTIGSQNPHPSRFGFCVTHATENAARMGHSLDGRIVLDRGRKVEMSLNIKSEQAHRLARELAQLTGESMTAAVEKAVEERLERVRRGKKGSLAERLLKIGRECAPLWKEPYRSMEHGDLLYDEKGLPK